MHGDDEAEAKEKALAEHVARHPEDVGRTADNIEVRSRTLRVPNTTQGTSKSMVVSQCPLTTSIQNNFHRG
jgi:hypothetical protein